MDAMNGGFVVLMDVYYDDIDVLLHACLDDIMRLCCMHIEYV